MDNYSMTARKLLHRKLGAARLLEVEPPTDYEVEGVMLNDIKEKSNYIGVALKQVRDYLATMKHDFRLDNQHYTTMVVLTAAIDFNRDIRDLLGDISYLYADRETDIRKIIEQEMSGEE